MQSFCRTCFIQIWDTSVSLNIESYKLQLMFCIPEMNLRAFPNAKLCKECITALDITYNFKVKCRKVEDQIDKRLFNITECSMITQGSHLHNSICRICLENINIKTLIDDSSHLTKRPFYKSKLMFCVPEMNLQVKSDINLCNNCHFMMDKIYIFKMKCLDVENNIKEYLKLYDKMDLNDMSMWYNPFIKYEVNTVEDRKIKQEEIDLVNEDEPTENLNKQIINATVTVHTVAKPFKCSLCEYSTVQKEDLIKHIMKHTGGRPFKCLLCGYSAVRKSFLESHIRRHTGEKPFKCSQCDYSAIQKSQLKIHNHIHTGEKPFKCSLCEYGTSQSCNLINHIRRHTGEKPFKCLLCKYSAVQKQNLIRHIKTHTCEKPFQMSTV